VGSHKRDRGNNFLDRHDDWKRSQRHPMGQLGSIGAILRFRSNYWIFCYTAASVKGDENEVKIRRQS